MRFFPLTYIPMGLKHQTKFWYDNWCKDSPLKDCFWIFFHHLRQRYPCGGLLLFGGWLMSLASKVQLGIGSRDLFLPVYKIWLCMWMSNQDKLAWEYAKDERFSMKSFYRISSTNCSISFTHKRVWGPLVQPGHKICFFVWKTV